MGAIYWFVFGVLYSRDTSRHLGEAAGSYPLFLITGIFAWMWASSALTEATNALTGQARLITTMNVPRQVFPIGRVIGRFAEYAAGLPILVAIAVIYAVQRSDPPRLVAARPAAGGGRAGGAAGRAGAAAVGGQRADARRRAVHAAGHPGALLRHADHLSAQPGAGVRHARLGEGRVRAEPAGRDLPAAPRGLVSGRVPGRPAARRARSSAACWCWLPAGGRSAGWNRPCSRSSDDGRRRSSRPTGWASGSSATGAVNCGCGSCSSAGAPRCRRRGRFWPLRDVSFTSTAGRDGRRGRPQRHRQEHPAAADRRGADPRRGEHPGARARWRRCWSSPPVSPTT